MALKRFGCFCVFVSGPSFKILSMVEKKDTAHPWVVFRGGAGLGYRRQKKEKKKRKRPYTQTLVQKSNLFCKLSVLLTFCRHRLPVSVALHKRVVAVTSPNCDNDCAWLEPYSLFFLNYCMPEERQKN